MNHTKRFGQKIRLPSTAQIRHELRLAMALDKIKALVAEAPLDVLESQAETLRTLLALPDRHLMPSPQAGMEQLRRGDREQALGHLRAQIMQARVPHGF